MNRRTRKTLALFASSVLFSTQPDRLPANDDFNNFGNLPDPSRCYWLQGNITSEGLCGAKMAPDLPRMISEARQGNAFAAYRLGQLYASGNWGVTQDDRQAVEWFRIAAEGGQYAAQIRIAQAYEFGRLGLSRDLERALYYYRLATEAGLYPDIEAKVEMLEKRLAR